MIKKERKKGSGGKRKGAGRKNKFGEPSVTISERVPKSKKKEIKEWLINKINTYVV